MNRLRLLCHTVVGCFIAASLAAEEAYQLVAPIGLNAANVRIPKENALTHPKIELGKQLYFDPRLSRDDTISCASCHDPKQGWSNGAAFATGVRGQVGGRSAPTIVTAAYLNAGSPRFAKVPMFWDGRAEDLEGQALGPIQNPIEMDMSLDEVVAKLNKIEGYRQQFQTIYGTDVTSDGIAKAIASFERTVLSGDAPIDRFLKGDQAAMSDAAKRGWTVFNSGNKANCSACHKYPNFTDGGYHNIGVGMDKANIDHGRYELTKLTGDKGAFKTPTLREIARTAPYMHDGSHKTLEEVVDYYVKGGFANPQLDEEMRRLTLTDQEKQDLVTFLKEGLASPKYPHVDPPKLPD
jgi:cytochrome c peroxidase